MCVLPQGVRKMERLVLRRGVGTLIMRRLGNRISRHGYPDPGGFVYQDGVFKEAVCRAYLVARSSYQVIQDSSLSPSIFPTCLRDRSSTYRRERQGRNTDGILPLLSVYNILSIPFHKLSKPPCLFAHVPVSEPVLLLLIPLYLTARLCLLLSGAAR